MWGSIELTSGKPQGSGEVVRPRHGRAGGRRSGRAGGSGKRASGRLSLARTETGSATLGADGRRRGGGRRRNSGELRATAAVDQKGNRARQKNRKEERKKGGGVRLSMAYRAVGDELGTAAGDGELQREIPVTWARARASEHRGKREEGRGFIWTRPASFGKVGRDGSRRWRRRGVRRGNGGRCGRFPSGTKSLIGYFSLA
ncbi:hypothetical protein BRADI_3g26084v3 [Brachypodium distachyon]|uniref:Uncharacterized protein n=1 Tax=Brachypodium distachyon TaxID=15368 RepID=A0A2K2CZB2_BRADI|nr:hypothetical protein BRADI_3g26084v3 [Brachypodium distachyon]